MARIPRAIPPSGKDARRERDLYPGRVPWRAAREIEAGVEIEFPTNSISLSCGAPGQMASGEIEFPRACPPRRTTQQEIEFPTNSISSIVNCPSEQNDSEID